MLGRRGDAGGPVDRDVHHEALGPQPHGDRVGDRRLVLDDEHGHGRFHAAEPRDGGW